ncbi:pheophytinase, chloroplastic isoform X1 [Lotus japonicus]|uniref:pheophytinase, chloroplastic isoform X1 n=1 Tax=Lotus japonicus TaxID=34305 RepID=UPI002582B3DE|nr:pheophytinase, chloroplastic isoform X1 [Lotus japonicus]XP_057457489.1 pheophytinase, chloroplastic isoform X1 [Lotus japonicus]XP_057457490.1 pheophytinase, chloroplastic isoform X1 [Lotus japonicus]XP_057457491.1 pheophytinase, chloroplastic isoform X1 [Lotus japonicus]
METLSYGSAPCCQVVNSKLKVVDKGLNSRQSRVSCIRKRGFDYTSTVSSCGSVMFYDMGQQRGYCRVKSAFESSRRLKFKVYSGGYDGYVIGEEEVRDVSGIEEPATKVLIPGLPDESNGESGGAPISSCFWGWKPKFTVHYEKAGCENVDSPPVLFLPGFGVGSFHYEKQLKDLGLDFRVWALDFLGQGMSLPFEDPAPLSKEGATTTSNGNVSSWGFGDETEPWAAELVYSADLWKDQVRYFIEEVIGEPVYLVGNSLGGYVALYFAACYPHLVKGVTLLNATPFWGFLPNPVKNPRLGKIFRWAGTFPLPSNIKSLTMLLWEKISDPKSIAQVLNQVYADHSINVDNVFSRIIETTRHPAAAASFASIMCAPRGELSFNETLSRCRANNVPICLMYGKEDPWVKPFWGSQVKKQVPEAPYYQISPAGHCPHDEVPEVINFLLRGWIRNVESQGAVSLPLLEDLDSMKSPIIDRELEFPREGSKKSVAIRYFVSSVSLMDRIRSYIKSYSKSRNLALKPQ